MYAGTGIRSRIGRNDISNRAASEMFHRIKERCYRSSRRDYEWYGGKGIKVCDEWMDNPRLFEEWYESELASLGGPYGSVSIDRLDTSGDYSPDNCRLIPASENSRWKSTTMPITVNGKTLSGKQWASELGLGVNHINRYRRNHGQEATVEYIEKILEMKGGEE